MDQSSIVGDNRLSPMLNNSPGPPSTVPRSSSDQLPTDLSDSSPSESESEKQGNSYALVAKSLT